MSTIAFVGLGNMGGPMAANLVKAGHEVLGFDLVAALCESAAKDGVAIAASAIEAVTRADIAITMLPAGKPVVAVWSEIVGAAKKGALLIDSSTIDVDSARRAHAASTCRSSSISKSAIRTGARCSSAARSMRLRKTIGRWCAIGRPAIRS